jgi:hypothetical protein
MFSLCHLEFFECCHVFRQQFSLYFAFVICRCPLREEFSTGLTTRRDPLLWCCFAQRGALDAGKNMILQGRNSTIGGINGEFHGLLG